KRPPSVTIPALDEAVRIAMENRPELRQAALDMKNKEMEVQYTENQKLPILDVTGTFNQNGTGGTRTIRGGEFGGSIIATIPGGVADAFQQLFGYDYKGYSLGFSLTIPLNNKAAKADYDRAINERSLTKSKLDVTRQSIILEVRNALTTIEEARGTIDASRIA